MAPGFKAMQHC